MYLTHVLKSKFLYLKELHFHIKCPNLINIYYFKPKSLNIDATKQIGAVVSLKKGP